MVFMVNKLTAVTNHFDEKFRADCTKKTTAELITSADTQGIVARDTSAPVEIRQHADKLCCMTLDELCKRADAGDKSAQSFIDTQH